MERVIYEKQFKEVNIFTYLENIINIIKNCKGAEKNIENKIRNARVTFMLADRE